MILPLSFDEVITTTRAVRKRLDFDTPVPREILMECLELALQAPSGSNIQGWQWVFITDPEKKAAIADIYREGGKIYFNTSIQQNDSDPERAERQAMIAESAHYLAEHLQEVPVFLIPCLWGRVDGAPIAHVASFWASLFPAVWSFCLALRSRGLGSCWTTLHLLADGEKRTAEILGIPYDKVSQGGLIPIAYTKGTTFKPARRIPAEEVTHWNQW